MPTQTVSASAWSDHGQPIAAASPLRRPATVNRTGVAAAAPIDTARDPPAAKDPEATKSVV